VLLASGIGALSPGVISVPAWAQQGAAGTPSPGNYYATPPPVDPSALIADTGAPDKAYKQTKACVQQSLGEHVDIKAKPWGQEYLQIENAQALVRAATHDHTAGGGIKVAVIDTGVTPHPYFGQRIESGGEYVAPPPAGVAPGLQDCDGHGTEVAGIIAANPPASAGIGFIGVAPDSTIVSIRQSSENFGPPDPQTSSGGGSPQGGSGPSAAGTQPGQTGPGRELSTNGSAGDLTTLAMAIRHAADLGGIKVINMSVDNCRAADGTITPGERALHAAIDYAFKKDIVMVAAAGNTSGTCPQNDQVDPNKPKMIVTPPWFSDEVLSVGAIDETGGVANFSVNGPWVSVAAPGSKITSLDPAVGATGLANLTIEGNQQPTLIQGTSFASPYVAGVVALVRAKYQNLNARQVMQRIMDTAQHPAAPGGRDTFIGHGVVNPIAALTASLPSEEGIPVASNIRVPADLPPPDNRNWTPMIVALAGAGGGLIALLITLFVVHTIRRNRPESPGAGKPA
jgi:membrane-anchored mycosin MYCP